MKKFITNRLKCLFAILLLITVSCSKGAGIEDTPALLPTSESGKTLIVYFSWSGNTRTVANIIHDLTDCDTVEIEVEEPYSDVYNEVTARARHELDNDMRPALRTRIENMDKYDTLIVGTPIWGSHLAPPVKSFLAQCDLSDKIIAPFCTHGGSGTAQSVNDIREVCPDSEILQPLAVYGSRAGNSRNEVIQWLQRIGIIK